MNLYIGIMSGTSMDGVDAVLVEFANNTVRTIESQSQDFPKQLKTDLTELLSYGNTSLQKIGEIDHQLALCYADAVNKLLEKANVPASDIKAIGCHGQTAFHAPNSNFPFTMQLGDGNLLASKTKIKTVADFRRMDMAFGGQGAPLVPAFHQGYFFSKKENRAILNLGGIANITILAENDANVLGFDTGPANCLMDSWIFRQKGEQYDKNGDWAKSGKANEQLLSNMLKDPYFSKTAPKSTGRELFNLKWLVKILENAGTYSPEDVQATLLELTAKSIALAINDYAPKTDTLYVCGGGAYNTYLLKRLSHYLHHIKITTTNELGIPPQQVEAVAFAWLAMQRINNLPGNLPSATGARRKALLGVVYDPS